ncbi:hypothetical protein D3C72_2368770 [compost metagenome]
MTLLLGYDPVARMKVLKHWQDLEAQQAPVVPQTMAHSPCAWPPTKQRRCR